MAQTACYTSLFTLSDFVYGNVQGMPVSKGSGNWVFSPGRSFIPYAGATLNANGIMVPDSIANNISFIATFVNLFKEARQASINEVQGIGGSEYDSDFYQQYLYKRTYQNDIQTQRYLQQIGIVFDFWTNANLAWTPEEYLFALKNLVSTLIEQADKNLYVPPGLYTIDNVSALAINLDLWKAGNAAFIGFLTTEFYQSS